MQMAYECSSEQVKSFGFAYRMMMEMLGALPAAAPCAYQQCYCTCFACPQPKLRTPIRSFRGT